ncbi:MAG: aminotransferase class V-fold PLP-dependent enzyme [Bacteroidota bacterium]
MTKINFDHINSCPIDSDIIDESAKIMHEYFSNPNDFHEKGRAAKAKIAKSRNFFAESLNVQVNELYFLNDAISQTKLLIDYSILIIGINHIFTSVFEDQSVLNYLKVLEQNNKIRLSFVPENTIGEINLNKLKELFNNSGATLLSLSHANEHNGLLLPVKDIQQLCRNSKVLFHLNLKSTIGKYNIDIHKIKPDFASFDFISQYGPKNIGVFFLNQSVNITDGSFHSLKNTLKNSEKIDISSITSMSRAFFNSINSIQKNQKQIKSIKEHFISEFIDNFNLNHLLSLYHKEGLYSVLCYFFPQKQFGNYIAEKLDINGIAVGKINYPKKNQTEKGEYIRFSFSKHNTIKEIDFMIDILKKMKK